MFLLFNFKNYGFFILDELDRGCCLLDCYTKPECKLATGAYCRNPPLECAQGRITILYVVRFKLEFINTYLCQLAEQGSVRHM